MTAAFIKTEHRRLRGAADGEACFVTTVDGIIRADYRWYILFGNG